MAFNSRWTRAIDDVRIVHALISLDYGELIIQTGNGSYALRNIMDTKESQSTLDSGFRIRWIRELGVWMVGAL